MLKKDKKVKYYELREIDDLCAQELQALDLYPESPSPVNIDLFIERKFGISHSYENLPSGVLGYTAFGPAGVEKIVVATFLDEEGGKVAERRVNTTLAHEAGHGLLHFTIFQNRENDSSGQKQKFCREVPVHSQGTKKEKAKKYDPLEFQANRAMSALLLPSRLVQSAVEPYTDAVGLIGYRDLNKKYAEEATLLVSEVFNVNPVVARFRLEGIYPHIKDA